MKVLILNKDKFFQILSNIVICLVIGLVAVLSVTTPIFNVSFLQKNKAIYSGNANNKNVSLMINVYWGTEYIEPMLEVLKEENVKATFFVGGQWVSKNNDFLTKIVAYGNEIGNHGYFHKQHSKLNQTQNQDEIYANHQLVKEITGIDMNLFAPPSGDYNELTLEVANNLGYKTIMWSKDTIDWRDKDRTLIYQRATKNPQNGDLILMHPTEQTAAALRDIISFYKNKGFNVVTVSENISY